MKLLGLILLLLAMEVPAQGRRGGGGGSGGGGGGPGSLTPLHGRCEPITIPMCSSIAYNDTIFPNLLGNVNQEQAGQDMSNYVPLINIQCSLDIHLFLCSLYAPVCTILDHPIPPCRALCLSARAGCEELMRKFDFPWPKEFECSRFPVGGKPGEVCVGDSNHTARFPDGGDLREHFRTSTERPLGRPREFGDMSNFKCPVQLQVAKELEYKLFIGEDQVVEDCGAPCYHNLTFFNKDQIQFVHHWVRFC